MRGKTLEELPKDAGNGQPILVSYRPQGWGVRIQVPLDEVDEAGVRWYHCADLTPEHARRLIREMTELLYRWPEKKERKRRRDLGF